MKTLLALLVALVAALAVYTLTQDFRAMKVEELSVPEPKKAVPQKAVLKVLNWEGYIPATVYQRLLVETGIKIEEKTFTNNEDFIKILATGEQFDVTMPTDFMALRLAREGRSEEIDYSKIPNHTNIAMGVRRAEEMRKLFRSAVPIIFGTVAIGYNASQVERLPLTWGALFNPTIPAILRGHIAFVDDARNSLGLALLALGKSPNSHDPGEVRAAGDLIINSMKLLPRLELYGIGDKLERGQLYLTMAWSGETALAMEENKDVRFISPDEGSLLFFECFAIMHGTKQRAVAEEFINFMLRPDISAQITNHSYYATLNDAATPYISRSILNGAAYYFPHGPKLYFRDDLGDDEKIYTQVWDDVRAHYATEVKPKLDQELFLGGSFLEKSSAATGEKTNKLEAPDPALKLAASSTP